jgi:phosphate transport system substrate-binding protein
MLPHHATDRTSSPRPTGFLAAVALAVLVGGVRATPSAGTTITIKGSDTMLELDRELAQSYATHAPDVTFVVEGEGSETGIRALLAGKTDIAAASRRMRPEERAELEARTGAAPREIVVGLHGIGVYVHTSNPVSRLTVEELERILTGEVRNWHEVGGLNRPIDIYNRNPDSGTRAFVREHVLAGKAYADTARDVSSSAMLMAAVSANPRGLGYSGFTSSPGIRILRIARDAGTRAFAPNAETVRSGDYPLSRPLYFYLDPTASSPAVQAFVDWVLSPEGQYVVAFAGHFPARPVGGVVEASAALADDALRITPGTMQELGFKLVVGVVDDGRDGGKQVSILFASSGAAIRAIGTITLVLGEDARVPLALGDDISLEFALRDDAIARTTLELVERARPDAEARTYVLRLADFHTAR